MNSQPTFPPLTQSGLQAYRGHKLVLITKAAFQLDEEIEAQKKARVERQEVIKILWDYFARVTIGSKTKPGTYRSFLTDSKDPQSPNFNEDKVRNAFYEHGHRWTKAELEQVQPEALVEALEGLFREIEQWLTTTDEKRLDDFGKKKAGRRCYMRFWIHYEWIDLLFHRVIRGLNFKNVKFGAFPKPASSRPSISGALRLAVWEKIPENVNKIRGICCVCDGQLDFDKMECAHNIPDTLGGPTNLNNLFPACGTCNGHMGIRFLEEYITTERPRRNLPPRLLEFHYPSTITWAVHWPIHYDPA